MTAGLPDERGVSGALVKRAREVATSLRRHRGGEYGTNEQRGAIADLIVAAAELAEWADSLDTDDVERVTCTVNVEHALGNL